MASMLQHKRVEFTELFYDLVFVYAISKTTGLIHHLHHGILEPMQVLTFLVAILLLVNTWMYQTVFTNRYGKNSLLNMGIMFVDMGFLMYLSNSFTLDWEHSFHHFSLTVGLLSATLLLQYVIQYLQSTDSNNKEVNQAFILILSPRTFGILLSTLFPYSIGIWIYQLSFLATLVLPVFFRRKMGLVPINFPHLVERISLLSIIAFGEMIVGVAQYFSAETLGLHSFLFLFIVILLFLLYFGEFDHAIDENSQTLGMGLIYSHYAIYAGILMTTVSLTFLTEAEATPFFVVGFLYTGLFLILGAILWNGRYNKPQYRWTSAYLSIFWFFFGLGLMASLFLANSPLLVTAVTTVMLFGLWLHFILFYTKNHRLSNDSHPLHWL